MSNSKNIMSYFNNTNTLDSTGKIPQKIPVLTALTGISQEELSMIVEVIGEDSDS